jgi:hypothetical protein
MEVLIVVSIKPLKENSLKINDFKGLNITQNAASLKDNESPNMMNFILDDRGALDKNFGYQRIFEESLDGESPPSKINGLYEYKKVGASIYLIHHKTTLYKIDLATGVTTSIYTEMANQDSTGFTFDNKFYILDGEDYLVYDGTEVKSVAEVAFVPTIAIGTPPAGGGTLFDEVNLLTPKFKQSFFGNGSATVYQLALTDLDAAAVSAEVNGTVINEGAGLTVNRTTGKVTFSTAPSSSVQDNVVITASKTLEGNAETIKHCRIFTIYGGSVDTRVWVSGNPLFPNRDFKSGLIDPTYFPELGFTEVGLDSEPITGYAKLYANLIVFKRNSIYMRSMTTTNDGVLFPLTRLNDKVGAVSGKTIQLIENVPIFLDVNGVYAVVNTYVDSEKNVGHISDNVDRNVNPLGTQGILDYNLDDYVSADFDAKYWLVNKTSGIGFVYDYRYKEWFKVDTHFMNNMEIFNSSLYMGDNRKGLVYKRATIGDVIDYNYDGNPIKCYWRSKMFDVGTSSYIKRFNKVFFTIKPSNSTSCTLSIRTDKKSVWDNKKTIRLDLLVYSRANYSNWTYGANLFPKATTKRVKSKKVMFFQFELRNETVNESLGIINAEMTFVFQKQIRR